MNIPYTPEYWDRYYGARYEDTCNFGLNQMQRLLRDGQHQSFLDIGCGPGQSLDLAQKILGPDKLVYGVEVQPIPLSRRVPDTLILTADFLTLLNRRLPKVDFVYATCSMYVPWDEQDEFIRGALAFCKKTVVFANVYDTQKHMWPDDILRKVSYPDIGWFVKKVQAIDGNFFHDPLSIDLTVFRKRAVGKVG